MVIYVRFPVFESNMAKKPGTPVNMSSQVYFQSVSTEVLVKHFCSRF